MIGYRIIYPKNPPIKKIQYYLLHVLRELLPVPILAQLEKLYHCLSAQFNEIFLLFVLNPIIPCLKMISFIKVYLLLLLLLLL
jgi:hypothetical protein